MRRVPFQYTSATSQLNLFDFLALDDWIVLPDLLGSVGPVVERAVVLVTVAVHCAEEAAASAAETFVWENSTKGY